MRFSCTYGRWHQYEYNDALGYKDGIDAVHRQIDLIWK